MRTYHDPHGNCMQVSLGGRGTEGDLVPLILPPPENLIRAPLVFGLVDFAPLSLEEALVFMYMYS